MANEMTRVWLDKIEETAINHTNIYNLAKTCELSGSDDDKDDFVAQVQAFLPDKYMDELYNVRDNIKTLDVVKWLNIVNEIYNTKMTNYKKWVLEAE